MDAFKVKCFLCHLDVSFNSLARHYTLWHRLTNQGSVFKCTYGTCDSVLKHKTSYMRHLKNHFRNQLKAASDSDSGESSSQCNSAIAFSSTSDSPVNQI